jgi:hypothetical protein
MTKTHSTQLMPWPMKQVGWESESRESESRESESRESGVGELK